MNCALAFPEGLDAIPGTTKVLTPEASVMVKTVFFCLSDPRSYVFTMGVSLGSAHLGFVEPTGHRQLHTTAVPTTSSICTFSALGLWKDGHAAWQKSCPVVLQKHGGDAQAESAQASRQSPA